MQPTIYTQCLGKQRTLVEISQLAHVTYSAVYHQYHNGVRGDALARQSTYRHAPGDNFKQTIADRQSHYRNNNRWQQSKPALKQVLKADKAYCKHALQAYDQHHLTSTDLTAHRRRSFTGHIDVSHPDRIINTWSCDHQRPLEIYHENQQRASHYLQALALVQQTCHHRYGHSGYLYQITLSKIPLSIKQNTRQLQHLIRNVSQLTDKGYRDYKRQTIRTHGPNMPSLVTPTPRRDANLIGTLSTLSLQLDTQRIWPPHAHKTPYTATIKLIIICQNPLDLAITKKQLRSNLADIRGVKTYHWPIHIHAIPIDQQAPYLPLGPIIYQQMPVITPKTWLMFNRFTLTYQPAITAFTELYQAVHHHKFHQTTGAWRTAIHQLTSKGATHDI